MHAIKIRQAQKCYEHQEILKGINLELAAGSVLALLGPSGCGKTTLLRLIAGFEPLNAGELYFGDQLVSSAAHCLAPEHRQIGYVPQEGTLFPHLTVEANIAYGLTKQQNRQERVKEVLSLIGLGAFAKRYPHELSGGQQQRVALGRALAPKPKLVLLDEPFNALDLELRRTMCEEVIALLRQTGTTTILVTHDPGEAFAVSDQLAVMMEGKIMQCAPPETVYWQPSNPTVARLTGEALFLEAQWLADSSSLQCVLGEIPLQAQCTLPKTDKITLMLRPEQIQWHESQDPSQYNAIVSHRSFRGDHSLVRFNLDSHYFSVRMPSLTAPQLNQKGILSVAGASMAWDN